MSEQTNAKAFKSGVWYTLSNFLVKSIGFITTPIFTRMLTHAEFGAFNNYTAWVSIVTVFVTLNLDSTLISARYDHEQDFDGYILSMLGLSTLSAAIWFAVMNLLRTTFTGLFSMDARYINVMLVYLLFQPAVNLYQARERYHFEYKRSVAASVTLALSTALLSVLLVTVMPDHLAGRIFGHALPTVLMGAAFFVFFIIKGKRVKPDYWKYALPICLPYIPHLLSLTLLNSTDRAMITNICGDEQNALYSLAHNCGMLVNLLMVSLNSAFAPWLGEKLNAGRHDEIRSFSRLYMTAFLFMAVGIMLVSPEVLLIMGGRSYMEAVYVMTPVSMGCVCQFLYTLFVNVEQFKKKTVGMAFASAAAALINLVLNWIFIPRVGYLAAAYTTLAGYLCLLVIHMLLVRRLKLDDVYDYRFVGLIVLIGMAAMVGVTLLFGTPVRYAFVAAYAAAFLFVLIKNKDRLLALVRRRKSA